MTGKINWNPSKKDLFNFGLVLLVGFGIIGTVLFLRGKASVAVGLWAGAGFVFLLAVFVPAAAKPIYFLWMGLGLVIGAVMSRIVITIIFYGVITPVALIFKLQKRDALNRHKRTGVPSYWQDHPQIEDKTYYDHMF